MATSCAHGINDDICNFMDNIHVDRTMNTQTNEQESEQTKRSNWRRAIERIGSAADGANGKDQQILARGALEWVELLLNKNADYGSSAWDAPILAPECDAATAIRVRLSDKINRLMHLLEPRAKARVLDESIADTVRDAGVYCLLWTLIPRVMEARREGREAGEEFVSPHREVMLAAGKEL